MTQTTTEPPVGELLGDFSRQVGALLKQEAQLASVELRSKATGLGRDIGLLALGGAVAYAGVLALVAAVVLILALALPLWLSALIVGVLVAGGGYMLVRKGLDGLKAQDLQPRATLRSIREDMAMFKEAA